MGKKRSERSPHSTPSSAPSTPSGVVGDTPPLPDDGTPALKAPKKESTTAPGTTGTTIPTAMAPAVATSVGMAVAWSSPVVSLCEGVDAVLTLSFLLPQEYDLRVTWVYFDGDEMVESVEEFEVVGCDGRVDLLLSLSPPLAMASCSHPGAGVIFEIMTGHRCVRRAAFPVDVRVVAGTATLSLCATYLA